MATLPPAGTDPDDPRELRALEEFGFKRTPAGSLYDPEAGEIVQPAPELDQDVTTFGEDIASFTSQFTEGLGRSGSSALIGLSELVGADRARDFWRERQDVMDRAYGGEGTGAGTAGHITGRVSGELSQFVAPGRALGSAAARIPAQAGKAGQWIARFAQPSGRLGRLARETATGGPAQAAIAAAGPEESMLGLAADLSGSEALTEAAENPYLRAGGEIAADVATMGLVEGAGAAYRGLRGARGAGDGVEVIGRAEPEAPPPEPTPGRIPREQRERLRRVRSGDLDRELEEAADAVETVRETSTEAARGARTTPGRLQGPPERTAGERLPTAEDVGRARARELDPGLPTAREAALGRAERLLGVDPEAGGLRHGLASTLAGGAGGAATGAALSEDPATGALAGGAVGLGATEAGRRGARRLLRGSADEAAGRAGRLKGPGPEVQKLDMQDPEAGEGSMFAVVGEKLKGAKQSLQDFGRRYFTVPGDLPDEVFQRKVRMDNAIQRELQEARLMNRDLDRTLRASGVRGGVDGLDESGMGRLDDALKGDEEALGELPDEVRDVVTRMRGHVDRLSRRMMDEGVVEGPLKAKVEENLGVYAHRSYRAFDDPRWAEKVPEETRNRAKAWFREEVKARHPDLSDAEVEDRARAVMNAYLYDKSESPLQFLASGKLGSKDLSVTMKRKDVPEAIRDLLGEYRDPRVNYVRSVAKMSRLMEAENFLDDVKQAGLGRFLAEEPSGENVAQIAAEGSRVMEPLDGLYTTPEIKDAFEATFGSPASGDGFGAMLFRGYMRLLGAAKFSKTIGSVMTHVRNFVSNPMFLVANGNNPLSPAKWSRAGKTAATNVGPAERVSQMLGTDTDEARDYFLRLQELGVVNQDARASELRDVVQDAIKRDDNLPLEFQRGRLRRLASESTRTYQAEDDFWKTVFYESEKDKLRGALPDLPEQELEERAAQLTQNLMPNYSQVPEGVKLLRRSPLVGPFVSFWAESMRVSKNAVRQAARELGSDNPAIQKIGARRAAGLLGAASLIPGVTAASRFENNIRAGEDRDIRRFLPPWSENSNIVYLGEDDEGNVRYVDLSYTDPHSVLRKPVVALLNGEDWESKLTQAGRETLEPFLGEELVTQKVADLARNRTSQGGEVFNEAAPIHEQLIQMGAHAGEVFEPGTITSARRVVKGLRGQTTSYGRSYDPKVEAAAALSGVRVQTMDVKQSLSFNVRDRRERIRDAQRMLTSTASNRGEVSEEDLRDAYRSMEQARRKAWEKAHRDAQAAVRLGVPEDEVFQMLDNTFSRRDAHDILRGVYRPYRPSSSFFQSLMDNVRSSGDREDVLGMATKVAERRRIILEEAARREPEVLGEETRFPETGTGLEERGQVPSPNGTGLSDRERRARELLLGDDTQDQ